MKWLENGSSINIETITTCKEGADAGQIDVIYQVYLKWKGESYAVMERVMAPGAGFEPARGHPHRLSRPAP